MTDRKFAHLHLHTHYSMLDGFNRIPELVKQTKKLGMNALAITDHGNLYGAVEFYTECKKGGLNPILGYEAYLAPGDRRDKKAARQHDAYSHLTLLAKNTTGFKNLIKLASIAFLEGYYYHPRIDREVLEAHSEGLICLSGCLAGEFNQYILHDKQDEAEKVAEYFARLFKKDFYIEIQNNGIGAQDQCTPVAAEISDKLGVPLVATADAHYLCADDAEAHDVLFCISTQQKRDPKKRRYPEERMPSPYYVRSPQDMYKLFPEFKDAVERSQEIADGVHVEIDFGKRCFPTFVLPKKKTPEQYLRELCEQGMAERYGLSLGGTGFQPVRAAEQHRLEAAATQNEVPAEEHRLEAAATQNEVPAEEHRLEAAATQNEVPAEEHRLEAAATQNEVPAEEHRLEAAATQNEVSPLRGGGTGFQPAQAKHISRGGTGFQPVRGETISRRNLPHIQNPGQTYHVIFRSRNVQLSDAARRAALDACLYWNGKKAEVHACVVMPDHVHLLLTPASTPDVSASVSLSELLHSIKSFSANQINKHLNRKGPLWQDESYDRYIRSETDLEEKYNYIRDNPVKDGLVERFEEYPYLFLQWQKEHRLEAGATQNEGSSEEHGANQNEGSSEEHGANQNEGNSEEHGATQNEGNSEEHRLEAGATQNEGNSEEHRLEAGATQKGERPLRGGGTGFQPVLAEGTRLEAGTTQKFAEIVKARLEHELGIIERMGFSSYFLVVWDFVRFAREKGIPSTARGSGCGAIVSYVLYLSHVCPIEYDLLFERFLDPNRKEAPDIDIDFCQDRRGEVIQYVKEKYGAESVAQIGTFGTLAAKAALKDVGRVLDVPLERVNFLCKLVPMHGQIAGSLEEAMKSAEFRKEYDQDPQVKQLVDIAIKLEGCNRNVGTHAAGVVIADGPITDFVPVQRPPKKNDAAAGGPDTDTVTTQWEMGVLEKVGMLKMDFLGLRNLTVLDKCVKLIKRTRNEDIDPAKFDLEDKGTYELLQSGNVKGVFQLESEGIRDLLKRMKPDNIRDLIAVLALYRPGPLSGGMVESYVNRKHRRETWEYPHPVLKEILDETYGVMVYQEQIMRILNRLGGIDLSKSYACIKAISKKVEEKINETRADFLTGCQKQGVNEATATDIFDKIVFFAGYGFNKSHTAAYAQIGYQTAYLKAHYTAEYMAALLSSEIDDGGKRDIMVDHIADTRKLGVDVLPPDINRGMADFDVVNNRIIFGLTAIKGLGRGAANEIVRARTDTGAFKDLFDFAERIDRRIVPKSAVERLIMAGAFDAFGRRAALFAAVSKAFQSADERASDLRRGQKSIFDMFDADSPHRLEAGATQNEGLPDVPEWPDTEKLKFEKEALDFYMSSHPLAQHEDQLKRFRTHDAAQAVKLAHGSPVLLAGMVAGMQMRTVQKNGKRWAMFQLEDFTGQCKCILWSDEYLRFKDQVTDDSVLLFEGAVEWRDGGTAGDVIVRKVLTIDDAKKEMTRSLLLRMPYADDDEALRKLESLGAVLKRNRGSTPVFLSVRDPQGKQVKLKLGDAFQVNAANLRAEDLEMIMGPGSVVFTR